MTILIRLSIIIFMIAAFAVIVTAANGEINETNSTEPPETNTTIDFNETP